MTYLSKPVGLCFCPLWFGSFLFFKASCYVDDAQPFGDLVLIMPEFDFFIEIEPEMPFILLDFEAAAVPVSISSVSVHYPAQKFSRNVDFTGCTVEAFGT